MRNKIINGAMVIDQRNAGASLTQTTANLYTLDRWVASGSVTSKFTVQRNAGSVTPPSGFSNYLGVTSSSAYTLLTGDYFYVMQGIEGFNVADLAFGTASAQTITVSFWVRSSLTGNFGGSIRNLIAGATRSYPFTYTISSANTWEQKSVTITGDLTGTWATDNTNSVTVCFGLGTGATYSGTSGAWAGSNLIQPTSTTSVVSTNGATFYITGVQLERGTIATPFEYRNYQQELAMCQRYYYRMTTPGQNNNSLGYAISTTQARVQIPFPVTLRSAPNFEQSGTATDYAINYTNTAVACSAVPTQNAGLVFGSQIQLTSAAVLTAGQAVGGYFNTTNGYFGFSAEL
jgi:hypothetical protein